MSTSLQEEVGRRRTFAIISHPDAGKTTLTEKMLFRGGAIHRTGEIKSRKSDRYATSDWMDMEKERGISVTSSVMQFNYRGCHVNLLDTPGHKDFSEDTYRVLTAVDSVIMVLDNAAGVEAQTEKLMEVCRMREIPIITYINKMDRAGLDSLDLLDDIEQTLDLNAVPVTWPIGMGNRFRGTYHLEKAEVNFFRRPGKELPERITLEGLDDERLDELVPKLADDLRFDAELMQEAGHSFDLEAYRTGKQTPVFFGTALHNFGVEDMLETFVEIAPSPQPRPTTTRKVNPDEDDFTGIVFKIQANMDPNHRDRMAFVRICSGKFRRGMTALQTRTGDTVRLNKATTFMAQDREGVETAFPGDIIGIHNHGTIRIGDSFTEGEHLLFTGVPSFAPEHFRKVHLDDPFRRKHLGKGLKQLSEEGAIQVYRPLMGSAYIVGAVGVLQFDVTLERLKHEYNVEAHLSGVQYTRARWVEGDPADVEKFIAKNEPSCFRDAEGTLAYLARNDWRLDRTIEDWPDLSFRATKEHVLED